MDELQGRDPPHVGPYLLLGRLGAGGMGQVYLGRSPGGRLVAVKVIRAELAGDPGFRARFAREVAAARKVSGLFTAPVVDADPAAPLPWLVTGFVTGPSLAQAVADHGALPVASVLALAAGLAEGLGAVHAAGVVHRDLKPSNVLLAADGPRVIDFGISQAIDATHVTRTGMVIGSPAFMSPEQVEGGAVGPASDVFSLGAVLVFAATAAGPFGTGTPTAQLYRVVHGTPHLDRLPGPVRPLVERCLAKDPGQRPTAGQFLAELTAAYPSAADLSDWLPASIITAASAYTAPTGHSPEPAAAANGQTGTPTGSPAPAKPSVAASDPPAPESAWQPTVTSAAERPRPGSASSAEQSAADAVHPAPSTGVHEEPDTLSISAEAVSPANGRSWPTTGMAGPASPVAAAGTAARNRRRRWAVSGLAAAAVLAAVIGVTVAAPWKSPPVPPVLRPTGLIGDSATISSVAFRWSGPATGPTPDKYDIVQDGQVVGSVPGNITYYQDAGLAPDTSYQFQVIAIRDGKRSPQSVVLSITTLTPPVSAAVLTGEWPANYRVTSLSNFTWNGTKSWSETWTFFPVCRAGPCNVTLHGEFGGSPFTATLARTGSVYAGTAALNNWATCGASGPHSPSVLRIRIQVQQAGVIGMTWAASSWSGTAIVDVSAGGGCGASTVDTNVSSY